MKKIITEKKTTLPFLKSQDGKKVKRETEKGNRLLPNIPKRKITKLNKLIYTRVKLVSDEIGIPRGNPNKNTWIGN